MWHRSFAVVALAGFSSQQSHYIRITLIPRAWLTSEIGRIRRTDREEPRIGKDFP